jgi:hypothetical protein
VSDDIVWVVHFDQAPELPDWVQAIPEWVPNDLHKFARGIWKVLLADPVRGPILKRVLTDLRMRPFYETLTAPAKRKLGQYKLQARFPSPKEKPEASARQGYAIGWIIWQAVCTAAARPRVTFKHEVHATREKRQELAGKVQELADELYYEERYDLRAFPRSDMLDAPGFKVLSAAADIIGRAAAETEARAIVAGRKSDELESHAHAVAIRIATEFELMFGSPYYKHTATVTAVALNLAVKIPWTRVRDWWKVHERHRDPNEISCLARFSSGGSPAKMTSTKNKTPLEAAAILPEE